jgi:hypothetical protein
MTGPHQLSTAQLITRCSSACQQPHSDPRSASLRTVALTCSLENPIVATFSTTSSSGALLPEEPLLAMEELAGTAWGST